MPLGIKWVYMKLDNYTDKYNMAFSLSYHTIKILLLECLNSSLSVVTCKLPGKLLELLSSPFLYVKMGKDKINIGSLPAVSSQEPLPIFITCKH